jgi:hypothetical protein
MIYSVFIAVIFSLLFTFGQVLASTPATSSADIETKVKDLVESKLSSQEASLNQPLQSLRGYQGTILSLKSNILTLESQETIQIKVLDTTPVTILGKNSKISDLAIGSTAIVYTRQISSGFEAVRIATVTPPDPSSRAVPFTGKVDASNQRQLTVTTTSDTKVFLPSTKTKIKLTDFDAGDVIIGTYKLVDGKLYLTQALTVSP